LPVQFQTGTSSNRHLLKRPIFPPVPKPAETVKRPYTLLARPEASLLALTDETRAHTAVSSPGAQVVDVVRRSNGNIITVTKIFNSFKRSATLRQRILREISEITAFFHAEKPRKPLGTLPFIESRAL
jgi:hypothetical protein